MTREEKQKAADTLREWNEKNNIYIPAELENAIYIALSVLEETNYNKKDLIQLRKRIVHNVAFNVNLLIDDIESFENECIITSDKRCVECTRESFKDIKDLIEAHLGVYLEESEVNNV